MRGLVGELVLVMLIVATLGFASVAGLLAAALYGDDDDARDARLTLMCRLIAWVAAVEALLGAAVLVDAVVEIT